MPPKIDLKPKYATGEKILCFHGPLLYEAKCLDVKIEDSGVKYFVHYQGWNKNWDEWVLDSRMRKYNEAGLKKQKELLKVFKSGKKQKAMRKSDLKNQVYPPEGVDQLAKNKDKEDLTQSTLIGPISNVPLKSDKVSKISSVNQAASSTSGSDVGSSKVSNSATIIPNDTSSNNNPPNKEPPSSTTGKSEKAESTYNQSKRRKTRGPADNTEQDDGFLKKLQLKIDFPEQLKLWLVDDWDLVTRQSRVIHVPCRITVNQTLDMYLKWTPELRKHSEPLPDLKEELVGGLRDYFNVCLGSQLLYKFERLQYAEILKQHSSKLMSQIYGPIHLLRLFVNLREMVSYTKVDAKSLPSLEYMLKDFLDFMDQNCSELIKIEDFDVATAEYQRRSMC